MYFRIYKALNVFIWMIPCRKKVLERRWSTRLFKTPFADNTPFVRVVERLCFGLTLINIHYCLYNCYIYICYKYCLNE